MRDLKVSGGINISGGRQTITINPPTQQELKLESCTEQITIKFTKSETLYFDERAQQERRAVRTMLREMIRDHIKIEPLLADLHERLKDKYER